MIAYLILASSIIGAPKGTVEKCIDSLHQTRSHYDLDFEKCLLKKIDRIEIYPDSSDKANPNISNFKFVAVKDSQIIYSEQIIQSKLKFHVETGKFQYPVSKYEFIIWSNKSGMPTNIMFIQKMEKSENTSK